MDVVAIERSDEGGVQQLHGLVRDAIRRVFGVFDGLDPDVTILLDVVVLEHVGQGEGAIHDQFRVVVEETEKSPLTRHEPGDEVHCFPST